MGGIKGGVIGGGQEGMIHQERVHEGKPLRAWKYIMEIVL